MSCCMLDKSSFVTETVTAVLPHAMEVSLVLSVSTMAVSTVFIKPTSSIN